ncbi:hypothetical protein J4732_16830 [Serratia marcescens]|uniref:Uncharacterized protein n=1 Tax=Serratia marcescens TaxID=615 RepID=A0A939NLE7_SERMA|nr:hypothetical protein [Serratia marcescens]
MPPVMHRTRYRPWRCPPAGHPLARRVAICSPPFSSGTTCEEHCPWKKKDQWNIGYWIVAGLLLLTLQNYGRQPRPSSPCPTATEKSKALARGASPKCWCRTAVTRRLKSPAGQDHHRGHSRRTRHGRAAVQVRRALRAGGEHPAT